MNLTTSHFEKHGILEGSLEISPEAAESVRRRFIQAAPHDLDYLLEVTGLGGDAA